MTYTKEQQAAHRRTWEVALRSREFPQTTRALRDDRGFCCLGVAAEMAAREGVVLCEQPLDSIAWLYDGEAAGLTPKLQHWLGINGAAGVLRTTITNLATERRITTLADLNDSAAYTFDQIADVIESDGVVLEGDPA